MKNDFVNFRIMKIAEDLKRKVKAYAVIKGNEQYPDLKGLATISSAPNGSWVDVEVIGLPQYVPASADSQPIGPFGFHLHAGDSCEPMGEDAFTGAMGHYNPTNQPHGNHAGDFPVLFSNNGYAQMSFYTDKFAPQEVIDKTVIIHLNPDDYRTQPSGNSGKRIACGVFISAHL